MRRIFILGFVLLLIGLNLSAEQLRIKLPRLIPTGGGGGGGGGLSLLQLSDLTWNGYYKIAATGDPSTQAGTTVGTIQTIAVRYTNSTPPSGTCKDTRRLLMANFRSVLPRWWGDLVEYCEPASTSYYTGTSPESATDLLVVRKWSGSEWTSPWNNDGDTSSGTNLGGVWWDETNQVLWVNRYGYYYLSNMTSHLAVQLNDTAHGTLGSPYKTVGTIYGPWYYRSTGGSSTVWKQTSHGFLQIPASAQSDMGGRTMGLLGTVGSVASDGHLGLGLRAFFPPALATTADTVMSSSDNGGLGLRLADYTKELSGELAYMHRPGGYDSVHYPNHSALDVGLYDVGNCDTTFTGGFLGCWQMTNDNNNGAVWVETTNVQGLLSFGRQSSGYQWYGWSPINTSPDYNGSLTDADPAGTGTNGYWATGWAGAIRRLDPTHIRSVAQGKVSPAPSATNWENIGDWSVQWPNVPVMRTREAGSCCNGPTGTRYLGYATYSNGMVWDPIAKQIIWAHAHSASNTYGIDQLYPATIQFFTVR
jgi:hypothetical protein